MRVLQFLLFAQRCQLTSHRAARNRIRGPGYRGGSGIGGGGGSHLVELLLELRDHGLLDDAPLLVQVLDYVLVVLAVDGHDDGLDGGVRLDQDACMGVAAPGVSGGRLAEEGARERVSADLG